MPAFELTHRNIVLALVVLTALVLLYLMRRTPALARERGPRAAVRHRRQMPQRLRERDLEECVVYVRIGQRYCTWHDVANLPHLDRLAKARTLL